MKSKLLTALKTEYAKVGLSEQAFDGVASVLVKTITNEDEIDAVVKSDETKSLVKVFQSSADKIRQEKAKLMEEFETYKKEHPETKKEPDKNKEDDKSEEIKKLLERVESLENENKAAAAKIARTTKLASVREAMKKNGSENEAILDLVIEKAEFKDEDSVEDIAKALKADYDAKYTKFYGDGPVPPSHAGKVPDYTGKEDDDFVAKLRSEGKLPQKEN